jgi:hypothetical protein
MGAAVFLSKIRFTTLLDAQQQYCPILIFEFLVVSVPQKGHQSLKNLFNELSIPSVL